MKKQIREILKVAGVIILGGFILGTLITLGARYIRYEGNTFRVGDSMEVEGNLTVKGASNIIPTGMVAMFVGSCPSGWSRFSEMDGRFPRGSQNYGTTGGSGTHSHSGSIGWVGGHQHLVEGGTAYTTENWAKVWTRFGNNYVASRGDHSHHFSAWSSSAGGHSHGLAINPESHLPPYRDIVFCKKN